MVYCGKPSSGCQSCRDKKTRCDRVTPSCGQCTRAQRTCPGYRNQLDLMFRNESEAVIGKVKAREKSKAKARAAQSPASSVSSKSSADSASSKSSASSTSSNSAKISGLDLDRDTLRQQIDQLTLGYHSEEIIDSDASIIPLGLQPTMEQRAVGYFSSNSSIWLRNFDFLSSLCSQTNLDEHLLASVSAVGLAGLANAAHAPELLLKAQKEYITALRLTNVALRSPKKVKKDSTLFSVVVLGIYESITGTNTKSLLAWTEHVNGATALVKLRGAEQFQSLAGRRMFLQVFSSMLLSCLQRTIPMPSAMIKLREQSRNFFDLNSQAWILSGLIVDYTLFQAKIQNNEIKGPRRVVAEALEVDSRFLQTTMGLSDEFSYKTVYTDQKPDIIWNGYYHVYENHWIAQLWNGTRCCRIFLHWIIKQQLLIGASAIVPIFTDDEAAAQDAASFDIMLNQQDDILASIPHNFVPLTGNILASTLENSRGYFTLWPLYMVGGTDLGSPSPREWVINRLISVADTVGIAQARVLAELLRSRQGIESWEPLTNLSIEEGMVFDDY